MATVSQVDIIEVNSLLNPISAGAMSQVSGEVLGGYELQPINPSDPLDDSTGDWVAWCDKDQVALQSVPEENEGDEETPVKVTSLVSLIVDLISNLKLFFLSLLWKQLPFEFNFTFKTSFFELHFLLLETTFSSLTSNFLGAQLLAISFTFPPAAIFPSNNLSRSILQ